ncbi:hypothetical protein [Psychroflexus aestuariivivens]|uniref:hypothetical protein n=1 Tax=Psychroflexus aestuariivivens TaxID=1795040 RepID=UPI000FDBD4A0|nr:hypothetical protein [Psychroflexus aestuariivivens]
MWISKSQEWKSSHSDLSKYFIEKLKQQVDSTEIISNKHRTTNGLTLISEIINVAKMTKDRPKYKNRLISLLEESKDTNLKSNIVNDYIVSRYFKDIKNYYSGLTPRKIASKEREIKLLIIKSKIFQSRVQEKYYKYILNEIQNINFDTENFEREAKKIDSIISCFTPYVLFLGYSTTSISEIAYRYVFKPYGKSAPQKIAEHFNGKRSEFKFLIKAQKNAPEFSFIKKNLNKDHISINEIEFENVKSLMFNNDLKMSENDELFELSTKVRDPHNFLRILYDLGLKWYVAKSARLSLNFFTPFFDNVYWRFGKAVSDNNHKYQNSKILLDPINVPNRPDTLHETLKKLAQDFKFDDKLENGIPAYSNLLQPIYFYNLALGSKSIENSISLLWTSLEMIVPYRPYEYDIENVQYFVSKSLAIGSVGRELTSFILRYVETNSLNNDELSTESFKAPYLKYTSSGLKKWVKWLTTNFDTKDDPYEKIKGCSNLLCSQFCFLNDTYSGNSESSEYWLNKITSSEKSIKYQLDRIYLHRNQIVHTGKFINEYSNLWSHLEWYVGKLLSYCILESMNGEENLEKMFLKLHSKNEQIISILENNKDKKINEMEFIFDDILEPTWQFF